MFRKRGGGPTPEGKEATASWTEAALKIRMSPVRPTWRMLYLTTGMAALLPLLAVCPFLTGCASAGATNYPLAESSPYRFSELLPGDNSDFNLVLMSISGGGTRAASLAYGVLKEMSETPILLSDTQNLLEEVDVISSVSGGSFAAAYLTLHGNSKFLHDFPSDFLYWNAQGAILRSFISPTHWGRVWSRKYGRSDVAAEVYAKHLFGSARFSDLKRRPFLIINATDLGRGSQFSFGQEQFDVLCQDLSQYPIARAVAASSAFPILLTPLAEQNQSGTCTYQVDGEIEASRRICQDRSLAHKYSDHCSYSLNLLSYESPATRPYLHLIDGGVADNLGLRPVVRALLRDGGDFSARKTLGRTSTGKVVIIVVNARTGGRTRFDTKMSTPLWPAVLSVATGTPMAGFSSESVRQLLTVTQSLKGAEWPPCADPLLKGSTNPWLAPAMLTPPMSDPSACSFPLYLIEVSFDDIPDWVEREYFLNLPTSFSLPRRDVDLLIGAGRKLLRENEVYKRLRKDLAPGL